MNRRSFFAKLPVAAAVAVMIPKIKPPVQDWKVVQMGSTPDGTFGQTLFDGVGCYSCIVLSGRAIIFDGSKSPEFSPA